MKRIVQIIPSLDRSGAEKQLTLLAKGLPRNEFDVHVCALTRGGPYEADLRAADIPTTVIGKHWRVDPAAYWKLKRYLAALKPDLVQTWLFAANSYGRLAARQVGVGRIFASERCADPWKAGYELAIDRYLARWTDRMIVNSSGVRDFYVAHGLPAEKFQIIPNGIDLPSAALLPRAELLAQLALPADAKLIAVIGRLWPQKRIKDVIWGADLLQVLRPDVHVLVMGDGPQRARLEKFARQCRVEQKVHFLGQRANATRLLSACDLLWLTSGYEGLPNVVMEAMAAGKPVIATDIPGNRDLVIEGETGYLIPVGDRAALTARTNKLLQEPELAARLGAAGRERIASQFRIDQMISSYAELYRQWLA
jgi:glycosyltransferase involved in cell wall biosynthesis